jgi:hypothetical protein
MRKHHITTALLLVVGLLVSCSGNEAKATEQTDIVAIGTTIQFGGHEWRVLEICENNVALIVTEHIIERRAFHNSWEDVTWGSSDLRTYLNGTFLDRFSQEERGRIVQGTTHTADNAWYRIRGGNDAVDYVFLLSIDEVVRNFGGSGEASSPVRNQWLISDEYNYARMAMNKNSEQAWWWLRSPGFDFDFITRVFYDGSILLDGIMATANHGGVRPALWLRLRGDKY